MRFFKKYDLLIIALVIIFGVALGVFNYYNLSDEMAKAEIYYKSELIETIVLNTGIDKRFTIPQKEHVVFHLYPDGSLAFEESDCPDKICIRSGKLNMVGETAACLPNELIIKIVPINDNTTSDIDIIVGK